MKQILFLTNIASPYRVRFFDELGKTLDVTVLLSDQAADYKERDSKWFEAGRGGFRAVQLKKTLGVGQEVLCMEVISWLKKDWDAIVVCGYSSPTAMLAMAWLRFHKIPFYMEIDGGLVRPDSKIKYRFKKLLVSAPTAWISSGNYSSEYLIHYGAKKERIFLYPFTSLMAEDILPQVPTWEEKLALRKKLGLEGQKILLSVGRFEQGKGFDILLKAQALMEESVELYIIGGKPTEEYHAIIQQLHLTKVHFLDFKTKDVLKEYYMAADAFVLPTRSDVWGLVVSEAMACGLPVVTTDWCVAGMELVKNGENGYIVPVDQEKALAEKLDDLFREDFRKMGRAALETIRPYTIENMAKAHVEIFHNRMGGKP